MAKKKTQQPQPPGNADKYTNVPANKKPPAKPKADEDDLYDQGDIATPRRDPPYEDGL